MKVIWDNNYIDQNLETVLNFKAWQVFHIFLLPDDESTVAFWPGVTILGTSSE